MEFSRQEYWSGLLLPSPGDLPDPRIKSGSPALQTDILPSEPPAKPLESVMHRTGQCPDRERWALITQGAGILSPGLGKG